MKPFRLLFIALVLMVAIVTVISVTSARSFGGQSNYLPIVYLAPTPTMTPTPTMVPSPTPGPQSSCNVFFDDFSNEASGWSSGDDAFVRWGYLNGEYRVRSKQGGYYFLFAAPSEPMDNYSVEADIRWEGNLGNSYALLYDIRNDGNEFYAFEVNSEFQAFDVLKFADDITRIYDPTESAAINPGNGVNHLKVTVSGSTHTLEVNGAELATLNVANSSARFVGIMTSASPSVPATDARFDNYCVSTTDNIEGVTLPPNAPSIQIRPFPEESQTWQ